MISAPWEVTLKKTATKWAYYFLGKVSHLLGTIPKNLPPGQRAVIQQQSHVRVAGEAIHLVPGQHHHWPGTCDLPIVRNR